MDTLPELPEAIQRKLALQWDELIEKHGFTSDHLEWHRSQKKRHQAARPLYPLGPPHPDEVTYLNSKGEPVSYEEKLKEQNETWVARESDPAVIDSIGIAETISLAKERFEHLQKECLLLWSKSQDQRSTSLPAWLQQARSSVVGDIANLWSTQDVSHSDWFNRACRPKLDEALEEMIKSATKQARRFEIQHLENPRLSLPAIVAAGGDLEGASRSISVQETLRRAQEALERARGAFAPTTDDSAMWARVLKLINQRRVPKGQVPKPDRRKLAGVAKFSTPPGVEWPDITIRLTSDHRLQIHVGERTETRNFQEMGFADQRGGEKVRPTRAWQMLLRLAKEGGRIEVPNMKSRIKVPNIKSSKGLAAIMDEHREGQEREFGRGRAALEKRIEEIRERLHSVFSLKGNPIPFINDASGYGYQARFKIYYTDSEPEQSKSNITGTIRH